jgi:hypothetical protein
MHRTERGHGNLAMLESEGGAVINGDSPPFVDLPAALVEEVLQQATSAGDLLLETFRGLREQRDSYRRSLEEARLLLHESSLGYPPLPTTCAADGSFAIERLLSADLATCAAVAVEGLTPPSETRHWENPHHSTFVVVEGHHMDTAVLLRAIMQGRELLVAAQAPHDLVLLDGTLSLPLIALNQALHQAAEAPDLTCTREFLAHCGDYLDAYVHVLLAKRSDRQFVGIPKYSTRREVGRALGWSRQHDDRGLLTHLLQAGELTRPMLIEVAAPSSLLRTEVLPPEDRERSAVLASQALDALGDVYVFYYKPHEWLPAIRVEIARDIALNHQRLAIVVQGLKHQCATSAMLEPYPLYLADRVAKALSRALPAFRQVATQRVSEHYEGEVAEVFFAMHGYRSESGGGS